jgi:hypothetical protein
LNNGAEWIGSLKTGIRFQAAFLVGRHFRLPWVSEQRQPEIQSIRQKTVWQFGPPSGFVFRLPHHIKAA